MFIDPDKFHPQRTIAQITEAAAGKFADLAQYLNARGHDPQAVAHFLNQCLFCLFAEDAELLPAKMFERLLDKSQTDPAKLSTRLEALFCLHAKGRPLRRGRHCLVQRRTVRKSRSAAARLCGWNTSSQYGAINREASRAEKWWRDGRARPELRAKLAGLQRYSATPETANHRFFISFPISVAPEHSLIVIPSDSDALFGILSSRLHTVWALAKGGRMGMGNDPRYNSTLTFETFPFPEGLATEGYRDPLRACRPPSPTSGRGKCLPCGRGSGEERR